MSNKKLWGHRHAAPLRVFAASPARSHDGGGRGGGDSGGGLAFMPIYLLSAFLGDAALLAGYPKVKFSDGIFRFRPNAGVECQRGGGAGGRTNRVQRADTPRVDGGRGRRAT